MEEKIATINTELIEIRRQLAVLDKAARKDQRRGESTPSAITRLFQVLQERHKEWKADQSERNKRAEADIGRVRKVSASWEATSKPVTIKKLRISSRLEDALLPHVSYDKDTSLVWRRHRSEQAAREPTNATGHSTGQAKPWQSPLWDLDL